MTDQNKANQIEAYAEYEDKLQQMYYEIEKDDDLSLSDKKAIQDRIISYMGYCRWKKTNLQGSYDHSTKPNIESRN